MTDVLMRTSAGDITIELFDDKAPKTVENFLKLVDKKVLQRIAFPQNYQGLYVTGRMSKFEGS